MSLPLAVNDSVVAGNTPLLIDVLANDVPASAFASQAVYLKRPYRRGILAQRNGQVKFIPRTGNTSPETFTYTYRDTNGTLSNIATVAVNFDSAPAVGAINPNNGATGVPLNSDVVITFNEAVTVSGSSLQIACSRSGIHSVAPSGGPSAYTLDPGSNFVNNETCTVTVTATQVNDQDSIDPPNTMTANFISTFSTTP
jgi:Bacterial Ig-like domain